MLPTARLTLADVLRGHARTRADALAFGDGAVRLTWSEAAARVHRVAQALLAAGVGPGSRVLWLGQNSFRLQELLLACNEIGAMFCPANWRQQPEEIAFVIDDLEPALVVGQRDEVGEVTDAARAIARHAARARWLVHDADPGDPDGYETFVAGAPSADDPDGDGPADDPLLLVYTAAFSGRPNAAMLSSRALVAQGLLMAPWQGIDHTSVFLNSGPLFHIGTFTPNLSAFVAGGANVFVARNGGEVLARAIDAFGCTHGFVVGPMVEGIADANTDGRYDLSTFRGRRGHPAFDAMVSTDDSVWGRNAGGYGQTEVMGMATFNLLGAGRRADLGTHGRPSPLVQVRVVDEDDVDRPAGEVGEILVRGVTVMNGYWNRPELGEQRSRGGWHHTNDLGRFEADGTFSFVAPKGRMLKSAAENIYPAEVEQAVRAHPAVADCAVIGVPDERWVQSVKAVVVVADGESVTEAEIIEWCRARIASYKKPRTVELVDELPRVGFAVDYDALDARFGGGGYPGGTTRSA